VEGETVKTALDWLEWADQIAQGGTPERWPLLRLDGRKKILSYVRWAVFQRDGGTCLSCGIRLTIREAEIDHIVPWSAGGSDRSDNLRILCQPCNTDRSNFHGPLDVHAARRAPVCAWCIGCVHLDRYGDEAAEPFAVTPDMVAAFCGHCGLVSRTWPEETL
jgi:hypothetical protein